MLVHVYAFITAVCIAIGWAFKVEAGEPVINVADNRAMADFKVIHDKQRKVTCWIHSGYLEDSISCIPDWQLKEPQRCSEVKPKNG